VRVPRLICALAALCLTGAAPTQPPTAPQASGNLSGWAAIVASGDDHASHSDTLTETFDNARRDVAAGFEARGVAAGNVTQFSLRPERYPEQRLQKSDIEPIFEALRDAATRAQGGCLIYFTSHGSPRGIVVGDDLLPPKRMAELIDRACAGRPTAVILSACFSGIFVPRLRGPDRFILTAAKANRSSFGCGESDMYPFFDGCVIENLPVSTDLIDLAARVQGCVAKREDEQGMRPRSEPQLFVGPDFRAAAPPFAPPSARPP